MASRKKIELSSNILRAMAYALGWRIMVYPVRNNEERFVLLDKDSVPYNKGQPCKASYSFIKAEQRRTEEEAWGDLPSDI